MRIWFLWSIYLYHEMIEKCKNVTSVVLFQLCANVTYRNERIIFFCTFRRFCVTLHKIRSPLNVKMIISSPIFASPYVIVTFIFQAQKDQSYTCNNIISSVSCIQNSIQLYCWNVIALDILYMWRTTCYVLQLIWKGSFPIVKSKWME